MVFFGGKKADDEKVVQKPVAKKVYLIPENPHLFINNIESITKNQYLGKEIRAGSRIKVTLEDPLGEMFESPPEFRELLDQYNSVYFKVWRVEPEGVGIITEGTDIIIVKSLSRDDLTVAIDKLLGVLILLEEETHTPVGYSELKDLLSRVDIHKLNELSLSAKSEFLNVIFDIEEKCLAFARERGASHLALHALEGLHMLRKVIEGRESR